MFAHLTLPSILAFILFLMVMPLSTTALPVSPVAALSSAASVLAHVNAQNTPTSLMGRAYNPALPRSPVPAPEHPITDPARALAAASAIQPLRRAERFMLRMARAGTLTL